MPMVGAKPPADSKTLGMLSSYSDWLSISSCHHLSKFVGLGAVDGQHQGLLHERVLQAGQLGVERDDAVTPRLVGESDQLMHGELRACRVRAKKTWISRRKAAPTTGIGYCSSTAPRVPPKTMMAAVGCSTCASLPPSSSSPATIPPRPISNPAKLLLSTSAPFRRGSRRCFGRRAVVGSQFGADQDGATEVPYPLDDLLGRLPYYQLFAAQQGDDRVWRFLDILDQVRVDAPGVCCSSG